MNFDPFKHLPGSIILGASVFLTACGGSGGGGPATATIDDANKQEIAVAASEGAKAAANGDNSASTFGFKGGSAEGVIIEQMQKAADNQAMPQDFSSFCTGGGTATYDVDFNTGNGSFTYNNCVQGLVTINGGATITTTGSGSNFTTTISTNNLTYSYGSTVESYDFTITCTTTSSSSSCTYSSDALGIDGRTYTVSNANVTGNSSSGYTISATVTDPDYGNISITTDVPVTFNCSDGRPDAGQITVTAGSTTMTITFNNCSSFTVTFDGVATMYNWADVSI